ncbi:Uncharacterised protein [BD1-7 clade bacterium]|uniref:Paeninodin family lasso peptide n=1 Tax=BD1-7 clade bacterium TaxID=2029982 RepID=A0A5S9NW89_9GAMM|nr:Uncharacterised protein [BD1-7 clade bacterium]CAA0094962.1 Uncharacterised protein [BD1-7 clade bacterium]
MNEKNEQLKETWVSPQLEEMIELETTMQTAGTNTDGTSSTS